MGKDGRGSVRSIVSDEKLLDAIGKWGVIVGITFLLGAAVTGFLGVSDSADLASPSGLATVGVMSLVIGGGALVMRWLRDRNRL